MNTPIYETEKMIITKEGNNVMKTFKEVRGFKKRYRAEKAALTRLNGITGVPILIDFNDDCYSLRMSCLPGKTPVFLQPHELAGIKEIISASLIRGVARHSLPIRDILSTGNGQVAIVDFERISLKKNYDPFTWFIAKRVTLFHLNRLIFEYQPHLLSPNEKFAVSFGFKIQKFFRKYMRIRDLIRNS
jgi:hypothetical protein